MADYRSFCESCGNEVAFGHHAPGCAAVAAFRTAEQERRDFERKLHEKWAKANDEEILEEAESILRDIELISGYEATLRKKMDFYRREMTGRGIMGTFLNRIRGLDS